MCVTGHVCDAGAWAALPLQVSQPRLLVCGPEGAGQSHLAPALLYALEGLPVHAIGLPSLLSDASARCAQQALHGSSADWSRIPSDLWLCRCQ